MRTTSMVCSGVAAEVALALGTEVDPQVRAAEYAARYCLRSFPPGQECDWQLVGDSDWATCARCGSVELMPPGIALYLRVIREDATAAHEHVRLLRRVKEGLEAVL